MEGKEEEGDLFVTETFRWRIQNFSKLKNGKHYSDAFFVGAHKWRMLTFLKWKDISLAENFSLYLGVADTSTLPSGWSKCARFSLTMVNQLDSNKSITRPAKGTCLHVFKEKAPEWGYKSFVPVSELYDCSSGYLVNDMCIVKAKIDIPIKIEDQGTDICATIESSKKEYKRQELSNLNSMQASDFSPAPKTPPVMVMPTSQDAPGSEKVCPQPTKDSPAEQSLVKELLEVSTTSTGEVVDFRGLGNIEKALVPLLEEVCLCHPSLIECVQNRSCKFSECAFTALGQLLHFLETTKAKDMNEDACEHLRSLWEEVRTFKFNLDWLEPYVTFAFGLKNFVEVEERAKHLREEVEDMETELKRRRTALIAAEVDLEITRRDLPKTDKIDMNSELGYGRS